MFWVCLTWWLFAAWVNAGMGRATETIGLLMLAFWLVIFN